MHTRGASSVSGSSGRGRLRQLLGGGRAGTLWRRGASGSTAFSQQGSLYLLVDTVKRWLSSKIHINIFIDRNTQSLSLIPPFFIGVQFAYITVSAWWFCEFSQMPAVGWLTPQQGADPATPDAPAPLCDAPLSLPPALGPASPCLDLCSHGIVQGWQVTAYPGLQGCPLRRAGLGSPPRVHRF